MPLFIRDSDKKNRLFTKGDFLFFTLLCYNGLNRLKIKGFSRFYGRLYRIRLTWKFCVRWHAFIPCLPCGKGKSFVEKTAYFRSFWGAVCTCLPPIAFAPIFRSLGQIFLRFRALLDRFFAYKTAKGLGQVRVELLFLLSIRFWAWRCNFRVIQRVFLHPKRIFNDQHSHHGGCMLYRRICLYCAQLG